MPQFSKYLRRDQVRKQIENIWWINNQIKKGKIHATFAEMPDAQSYHDDNVMLMAFLATKGGIPYRIGAKERVDATWDMHFPPHFKVALDFLNDDNVKFFGDELMDFDDAGLFEDINVEIYILPPTSNWDYKTIA